MQTFVVEAVVVVDVIVTSVVCGGGAELALETSLDTVVG